LRSIKLEVGKTLKNNIQLTTISNKIVKPPNNKKPDFLKVLFAAYVKTNRAPNGRSIGVTHWLHSQYKHLYYHKEREHERKKDSFFESFLELLTNLQAKGKYLLNYYDCYVVK